MRSLCGVLAATLVAGSVSTTAAHATVVLSDNFDSENGGASALNYTGFANWKAFPSLAGPVNLVHSGDFGTSCMGGVGSCVDMGPTGYLESKQSYALNKGDLVNFSFYVSGDQQGGLGDFLLSWFYFSSPVTMRNIKVVSPYGVYNLGTRTVPFGLGVGNQFETFPSTTPFMLDSFSFRAGNASTFTARIQGGGYGVVWPFPHGPVVDNAQISIAAPAPEPSVWALMLAGLGSVGAALRLSRRCTLTLDAA
jgi:hypothetical protein